MESTIQDCDYLSWKSDKEIISIIKDGKLMILNFKKKFSYLIQSLKSIDSIFHNQDLLL